MCCKRLAGNTGRKSDAKNSHLSTIAQICRAMPSQLSMYRQSDKNMLNDNMSSICPQNILNFSLLTAEIRWRVWGTPANFNGFRVWLRYCSVVAQQKSTKVCTVFGRLLDWYTVYTFSAAVVT